MSDILVENWTVPVHALIRGELTDYIHVHHCIEIVTVLEGGAKLHMGNAEYTLTSGCTAVVFPSIAHMYTWGYGMKCCYCTVSRGVLSRFGDVFTSYLPVDPVVSETPGELTDIFLKLTSLLNDKGPYREQRQSGYAELLISGLLPLLEIRKVRSISGDNIERIMRYYNENISKKITLSEVADDLNISRTYITSIFRRYFGTTPSKYLTAIRIMEAKRMLLEEKRSLTDIALSSGFQSVRTFNRVFSDNAKMTPTQYRKTELERLRK